MTQNIIINMTCFEFRPQLEIPMTFLKKLNACILYIVCRRKLWWWRWAWVTFLMTEVINFLRHRLREVQAGGGGARMEIIRVRPTHLFTHRQLQPNVKIGFITEVFITNCFENVYVLHKPIFSILYIPSVYYTVYYTLHIQ